MDCPVRAARPALTFDDLVMTPEVGGCVPAGRAGRERADPCRARAGGCARYGVREREPHLRTGQEWVYAYVYHAALLRGDTAHAGRVAAAFLDHIDGAFAYFERRSREVAVARSPRSCCSTRTDCWRTTSTRCLLSCRRGGTRS